MLLSALLVLPDVSQVDAFAEPWRHLYSHSPLVSTLVLFGHLGGLLAGGGLTLAADRATLRSGSSDELARRRHLDELRRLRRPIFAAFAIAALSGALLFLADVEAFAASRIFWAKMSLVVLLLANLVVVSRTEAALRSGAAQGPFDSSVTARARLWRRRRLSAGVSVALWFVLLLAGAALASH